MASRVNLKEFRRVRNEGGAKERTPNAENEIKVTAKRGQHSYITYAIALLTGTDGKDKQDKIIVSGMGAAIYNAVNIAEIVKRRVMGIHQTTDIASEVVTDEYEAISKNAEEQIKAVDRKVSTITITLSTKPLDKKHIGYQEPLPEDQVTEQNAEMPARRPRTAPETGSERPRSSTRGGRGSERGGRGSGSGERGGRGGGERGGRGGGDRGGRGSGDRGGRGSGERGGRGSGERGGRGGRGSGGRGRGGAEREDRNTRGGSGNRAPRGGRN